MKTAIQVTMYLHESDKWHTILETLRSEGVAGACAFHAVAGFTGRNSVHVAGLVEAGGHLPVILFSSTLRSMYSVLPKIRALATNRLVVRENVVIEQSNLD